MTLLLAPHNCDLTISKIRERSIKDDNQKRHLNNMGFVKGAKISVVAEANGNLIVKIKDCRVGIGKELARSIMVQNI